MARRHQCKCRAYLEENPMSTAEQHWIPWISFKNILFAMDLSPGSLLAFPFATSIARHYGGKVFLAHIIPEEDYDPLHPASQAMFDKLEGLINTPGGLRDLPHEVLIDHGSIRAKLIDAANTRGIDVMVIGTHGWHGIKKLLTGSIAEEIAYLATRPVLTVGPKVSCSSEFKRILYATDFSAAAAHAMPYASSLAHTYHASMVLLHVNDWTSEEPPVAASTKTFDFLREQIRNQGYKGSAEDCAVVVEFGSCSDRILAAAEAREVDLIVMGLNCSTDIKARIAVHLPGSTVYDVISGARCPVLTVPFAG